MEKKGTLYFFTGLAGAGKSTIGGLFYERLKRKSPDAILQDGHSLRDRNNSLGINRGFSNEERLEGAWLLFDECRDMTDKGHDVVLCTICMFEEVRKWARENIENYKEIYIRVPMDVLCQRDQGGLYSQGVKNVVGVDLPWDEPDRSDVVIDNTGDETPLEIVNRIEIELGIE